MNVGPEKTPNKGSKIVADTVAKAKTPLSSETAKSKSPASNLITTDPKT